MDKRVLIMGASSMLGTKFRKASAHRDNLICQFNRPNPEGLNFSIINPEDCYRSLSLIQPDVILNFASATDVDWCESHEDSAFAANATIPKNIQNWIERSERRCYVIHISTDQVYDGHGSKASRENEIAPVNTYGRSKLAGERALNYRNSCTLRTNFFGKSLTQKKSMTDWVIDKVKRDDAITGFSDVYFSPIAMNTLVKIIDKCIEDRPLGIVNVGSDRGISKYDFICEFLKLNNMNTEVVSHTSIDSYPSLVQRPKNMIMNSDKSYSSLCLGPIDLGREIRSAVEEYRHGI